MLQFFQQGAHARHGVFDGVDGIFHKGGVFLVFGGIFHHQRLLRDQVLEVMDNEGGQFVEGVELTGFGDGLGGVVPLQVTGDLAPDGFE